MGSNHARYIFRAFTQVKDVCNNMQMSFVKEIFVVRNTYQESMMALQPDQKSLTLPPQSNHLTEMVSYNKWVGGGAIPLLPLQFYLMKNQNILCNILCTFYIYKVQTGKKKKKRSFFLYFVNSASSLHVHKN